MGDDPINGAVRRAPADEEMTRVDAPQARPQPQPQPQIPDAEPTRPVADSGSDPAILDDPSTVDETGNLRQEQTARMRPDQVDRRALPFKKPSDRRQRVEDNPNPGSTAAMRPAPSATAEPALPFDGEVSNDAISQPVPSDQATLPRQPAPEVGDPSQSVWSQDAVIDANALPSALAPAADVTPSQAPPARQGIDSITLITVIGVVLVLLICVLALLL